MLYTISTFEVHFALMQLCCTWVKCGAAITSWNVPARLLRQLLQIPTTYKKDRWISHPIRTTLAQCGTCSAFNCQTCSNLGPISRWFVYSLLAVSNQHSGSCIRNLSLNFCHSLAFVCGNKTNLLTSVHSKTNSLRLPRTYMHHIYIPYWSASWKCPQQ